MSLEFKCSCGKTLSVAEKLEGSKGRCPYCEAEIQYPSQGTRSSKIILSMDQPSPGSTRRLTGSATQRLQMMDVDSRKRLLRFVVLGILAVIAVATVLIYPVLKKRSDYAVSRSTVFRLMTEAETFEKQSRYVEAWQRYNSVVTRTKWYLREVDADDQEITEVKAKAEAKAASIRSTQNLVPPIVIKPERQTGVDPGTGIKNPPDKEDKRAPNVHDNRPTLEELLAKDKLAIHCDLRRKVSDQTPYLAAGLGVAGDSRSADLIAIWQEPLAKSPAEDGTGNERWSYKDRHGFDIEIKTATSTIEEIHLYPSFAGSVNGLVVKDSTSLDWRNKVGQPEVGSVSTLWRYKRPFAGVLHFDADGKFVSARISIQGRY